MNKSSSEKGKLAEKIAQNYLKAIGYAIVEQNHRNFFGEIDIIAYKNDTLTFIEVKSTYSENITALEKVTPQKCRRIFNIANLFIHQKKNMYKKFAFEIICVNVKTKKLNHFTREFFDF
ncbi:YraN family protein [Candidatus Uabimicrobium amorphum]|uniref:UPF0102 protein UABAM_01895 n=1 Tax=Uabimicrobium amorphum TaxID=2596890 RepID=A0A5S9IKH9_UABAM|nr:YraN family protein [Candidatus Uabimicrobium amorphum]BBM83543.1 UPF0102 protein [Candidatus Uabimicrobium amorphum]